MIREALISDFDAIAKLESQVFHIHLAARPDMIKPKDQPLSREYFDSCMNDEKIKIFVYEEIGEILGHCMVKLIELINHHMHHDMNLLEITVLCVDQKARNKGIGRQLFDRAKDYAKEIDVTRIELGVWSFNQSARQFYEHLGMSERISRLEMTVE